MPINKDTSASIPWLTTDELRTLREATLYYYVLNEYPEDFPVKLAVYAEPDGGLMNLIDQAITMSAMLERLSDHE